MSTKETDLELLEMAAKAAGLDVKELRPGRLFLPHSTCSAFLGPEWNPLTDDGDCARMEAVLGIDVEWWPEFVRTLNGESWDIDVQVQFSEHGGDRNAARRLSSTRVAAEIGKAMP